MRTLAPFLFLFFAALSAHAQKFQTSAGEAPGPWIFGTIGVGKGEGKEPKTTALKGLAVKVGGRGEAVVCYDLDLCRLAGAWTGKFTTPMNLMSRGEYPTAMGEVAFTTADVSGFQILPAAAERISAGWKDPRSEPFGPLPDVRYRGVHVHGESVALHWEVDGAAVVESPSFVGGQGYAVFTRTFQFSPTRRPLLIALGEAPVEIADSVLQNSTPATPSTFFIPNGARQFYVIYEGVPERARCEVFQRQLYLYLPPITQPAVFSVTIEAGPEEKKLLAPASQAVAASIPTLLKGGPSRWPETVETTGELAPDATAEAYVVDTIKLPEANPWHAPMYLAGFDFFPDGRAAVSTFHGDVFVVSGLEGAFEHIRWKRFASGLYHPLGLKIVQGEIYVTERSGITRLRDLNGDGEADLYEPLNWEVKVTKSFHEFAFDLQTDSFGNFYFAKAGPVKNGGRGFDQIAAHHGSLLRVSPDGSKFDVVATGFRAPNGIGIGPQDQITTGDNEGTWTPVCRLNLIQQGGFYGVVQLAHWEKPPTTYDKPICWLPKRVDNSSGSQVWVETEKWGPWKGQMLHLSYGSCSLFGVMTEGVQIPEAPDCCSHLTQGGVVRFPLKFASGIMRARFHPRDGQLYVAGLRGWQTTGVKNGCLQRVRYTGQPVRMPIELSARKGGIELKFTSSLDTAVAADPDNWSVEVWNYVWSGAYGSPEISTKELTEKPAEEGREGEGQFSKSQMDRAHHDILLVKSVTVGTDDRTVFLEIPEIKPVMQMAIKYRIKSADGHDIDGEVLNTIHAFNADN